ncbi:alpha/beta hydrolase [Polymorphobacter fuscus]|uniref:Alpha/beta hydrolase n=1 Tax=Sandarakinorhabdus fusca TaxID=1439888 RepID=A0A7C9GQT1_9SPHN|nr:alpha/beta hydrolase [Polymorphobacter fuscus]KAB7644112.1 alpha/beta hydrolase [Polymorphobacter fuscus]MQT18497.1 alpha/beta hydrolase [Polymorphobacter fuscus]NJC08382.1 esterase/lipase superfamily enzyme [Polymorphobacter fuscus]
MRRILIILLLVVVAVTVALSFYQPPMRLMPTPKLFLDGAPDAFAANPALAKTNGIEIFYATNRLPVGPRTSRTYAVVPGRELKLGVATIRIGGPETSWETIYAMSTNVVDDQRPRLNLQTLAEMASVDEDDRRLSPGTRAWLALVNAAIDRSPDKDIIIYVHGANSTVERAAGQAAQLRHFTGQNSVVLLFAWPTAENFLRYPRDMVTAFGAAPQLARLVGLLARQTRARNIDVLTYSAGGTVGSEGLALVGRQARLAGAADPRLGEVYHAAPDADTRGFVDDLRDYAGVARRVTVAANMGDVTLRLSQAANRGSRAGRPDIAELSANQTRFLLDATQAKGVELLRVRPEDIPDLSDRSHSFWYNDPWVSSDVLITFLFHLPPGERGLVAGDAGGAVYWGFPPDYPARLPGVLAGLRATVADQRAKAPVAR